jgi:G3E family GTPase
MAKIEQIPIILLTGFLGAGKTTLLSHWIRAPEFDGAMVIVNELGEVGLDHHLLETSTDAPVLLDSGCACCAAQEDLIGTLERLFWDRLHRRIPRFTWMLIETTGIADPMPILAAIKRHGLLGERYRIAGVVTALDALTGVARLDDFPESRNQLAAASAVILTKTDLATPQHITACRARLPDLAPHAVVLASANGELPPSELLSALDGCYRCGAHGTDHDHSHAHGTDDAGDVHAEHAGHVTNAFLPLVKPLSWPALISALDTLMAGHARTLLRLKGVVRLEGAQGYHAVQATPGQGITRAEVPVEADEQPPRTGFTLIAAYEPAAGIASSLDALIAIRAARQRADAPTGRQSGHTEADR